MTIYYFTALLHDPSDTQMHALELCKGTVSDLLERCKFPPVAYAIMSIRFYIWILTQPMGYSSTDSRIVSRRGLWSSLSCQSMVKFVSILCHWNYLCTGQGTCHTFTIASIVVPYNYIQNSCNSFGDRVQTGEIWPPSSVWLVMTWTAQWWTRLV